jgi:hypothetical protein
MAAILNRRKFKKCCPRLIYFVLLEKESLGKIPPAGKQEKMIQ